MSKSETIGEFRISIKIITALIIIAAFTIFIAGYDQGHLFSIVQGTQAFDELYVHELFHDIRHAAGFPCH